MNEDRIDAWLAPGVSLRKQFFRFRNSSWRGTPGPVVRRGQTGL
jgi:hypothetical protein